MVTVQITDGRTVNFPDGMSKEEMAEALKKLPPAPVQETVGGPNDFVRRLASGIPGMEELTAGIQALPALVSSEETFMDKYNKYRNWDENQQQMIDQQMSAPSKVIADTLSLAPAAAGGVGAAMRLPQAASRMGSVGQTMGIGSIEGAIEGYAGGDESGDRAGDALLGGIGGGVLGGAIHGGGQAAGRAVMGAPPKYGPQVGRLKRETDALYKAARESGSTHSISEVQALAKDLKQFMKDEHITKMANPQITKWVHHVSRLSRRKKGMSASEMIKLRRDIKDGVIAGDIPKGSEKYFQSKIMSIVDSHLDNAADPVIRQARSKARQMKKVELLEDLFGKANRKLSRSKTGGDPVAEIKFRLSQILDVPKYRRQFDTNELERMQEIIDGPHSEGLLRRLAALGPNNGVMTMLHIIGAGTTGGATLPLMAAGAAAGRKADSMISGRYDDLFADISGATPLPSSSGAAHPGTSAILGIGSGMVVGR